MFGGALVIPLIGYAMSVAAATGGAGMEEGTKKREGERERARARERGERGRRER